MLSLSDLRPGQVSVRGLKIRYYRFGSGQPVVMLHGLMDHGLGFLPFAEALGHDYEGIIVDLRGHGGSDWVGDGGYYHFYDYFDDVLAVVSELALLPFHLIGHSMGGSVATGLAAILPDRVKSMVLLEGMGPPFGDLSDAARQIMRFATTMRRPRFAGNAEARRAARRPIPNLETVAARMGEINPCLAPTMAQRLAATITEHTADGYVWRFDPLHVTPGPRAFSEVEGKALWEAIECPVLSIFGEESPLVPKDLDRRHGYLKQVEVKWVKEAGHNLHQDQPREVADRVRAFFEAHQTL